jgi:hypothetical protein
MVDSSMFESALSASLSLLTRRLSSVAFEAAQLAGMQCLASQHRAFFTQPQSIMTVQGSYLRPSTLSFRDVGCMIYMTEISQH